MWLYYSIFKKQKRKLIEGDYMFCAFKGHNYAILKVYYGERREDNQRYKVTEMICRSCGKKKKVQIKLAKK